MHALVVLAGFRSRTASRRVRAPRTLRESLPSAVSRQRVSGILAAAEALVGSSVTVSVANRYQRIAELFCKWCDLMGLPRLCDTPQLSSWAWHYCEFFSWRSLSFHWCALQWWCDVTGNQFPAVGSTRRRLLQRCVRSLALSDPREEKRCFALCVHWLSRMQRAHLTALYFVHVMCE